MNNPKTNFPQKMQPTHKTMHKTPLFTLTLISAILLSLNLIIPAPATAQSTTIGQFVQQSLTGPAIPCALSHFTLEQTNINAPTSFSSYYINPKTPYSTLNACDGTGVTVQDGRYDGGFKLQVEATSYTADGAPANTITVNNLAIVTEQTSNSYNEDTSQSTGFIGSGDTFIPGTDGDTAESAVQLPFDLTFYGTLYPSGTNLYACSNGTINFNSGQCATLPAQPDSIFEETAQPRLLAYSKDLTTDRGIDATFGIYKATPINQLRLRWKGAPTSNTSELVEFEATITDNGTEDTIAFNYSATITDSATGPVTGVTKGGPIGNPSTITYTESGYSELTIASGLNSKKSVFNPAGFDFSEVKKPGTASTSAPQTGNPNEDNDYTSFPGLSPIIDLLDGHSANGCGRVGIYTVYPSFRLTIPETTEPGKYNNTITYTVFDDTGPETGC